MFSKLTQLAFIASLLGGSFAARAEECEKIASSAVLRLMHSVPDRRDAPVSPLRYLPIDEPALVSDAISAEYIPSLKAEPAGFCPDCVGLHIGSLLSPLFPEFQRLAYIYDRRDRHPEGKTVLIYIEGKLVGAIKNAGNRSFLAMRSVVNSKGETVLVRGAVYWITKELAGQARLLSDKTFPRLRLTGLTVNPRTWLVSHDPYYGRDPIIRELEKLAGVEPGSHSMIESHVVVMSYLSARIRQAREILESAN